MGKIILNSGDYYEKVYGGWMGKNIGGTLGGPVEGRMEIMNLTFYPKLSDGPMPNDDLDLQLVWLHALEQYGVKLTSKELGKEWVEHVFFPYDEYGYAITNLRRGLVPPVAGWFNNPFTNCMGSPIRSEIWAMVSPGAPGVAAYYAYQDAIVDHAGGEGVFGEMFFAAIESAAFLESDVHKLLNTGLSFIPYDCRTAKAVKDLIRWHGEGKTWIESRNLIIKHHGRSNFTDAPQNIAFTVLGWLYGESFENAILKAVNCGYDTDCTGATLGAILGILGGRGSLPKKWTAPVGDRVAVSLPVKGFAAPYDLKELTERTAKIARRVMAEWDMPIYIADDSESFIPKGALDENGQIRGDYDPRWLWNYSFKLDRYLLPEGTIENTGLEVTIDYGDGPSIGKGQHKDIVFRITNNSMETWEGYLELIVPGGWTVSGNSPYRLEPGKSMEWKAKVQADDNIKPYYNLKLNINRKHDLVIWNTESVAFNLVTANNWSVKGPDDLEYKSLISSGNRIEFEKLMDTSKKGIYEAKARLINPEKRKVRIIVDTASGVKAMLDGKLLFEDQNKTVSMPAYHRSPVSKRAEVNLSAGEHILKIEISKGNEDLSVYILPVATAETKTPGGNYYFTDILFS